MYRRNLRKLQKVAPKKETVRISLPPKPTASPTIKLPAMPAGGPGAAKPAPTAAAPAAKAPSAQAPAAPRPPAGGKPGAKVSAPAPEKARCWSSCCPCSTTCFCRGAVEHARQGVGDCCDDREPASCWQSVLFVLHHHREPTKGLSRLNKKENFYGF